MPLWYDPMVLSHYPQAASNRTARRYLRAPVPLYFPSGERVPESGRHFERKRLLWESIRSALGSGALVSCDQFLYWDPTDPKKCLAPDIAVRVRCPAELLDSWKTWEHGAPHVGVEIVSDTDAGEKAIFDKLERYRQAGIAEVVRFDPTEPGAPLQFWDLVEGDLVERDPSDPEARRSDALGLYWCVKWDPEILATLRLARDLAGTELLLTPAEAERAAKDAALADRDQATADRDAALARIRELEADLARRR